MNLKLNNIILTIIFVSTLISCQQGNRSQLETVKYKQLSFVEGWRDSIFLSQVRGLRFHDNFLYISDQYLSQVIETDKFFTFNRSIGKQGPGPKDFVSIESIALNDSLLYVFDMGHCAVLYFDKKRGFQSISFTHNDIYLLKGWIFLISKCHYALITTKI